MSGLKVLVTGGAGFIGANLVRYLLNSKEKFEITVIDDLSNGREKNLAGLEVDFRVASILDIDPLVSAGKGCDAIVHLGALGSVPRSVAHPRPTHDANITGTLNVLELARELNIGQVISASSSSVYGSNPTLPKSELIWTRPMSPYAVSKLATEAYTNAYRSTYGLKSVAFRFFNVYGPYQPADHPYAAVIPRFINAALSGEPLEVHGDGTQSRDFTYVETVCEAIALSLTSGLSLEHPLNLALGTRTSLLQLIDILSDELDLSLRLDFKPSRIGDVPASQADPANFVQEFPSIKPVPLRDGLKKTIDWFHEEGILS